MKIKTMPKEIACELLVFIAEKEEFAEAAEVLGSDIAVDEIKALLREIAGELQRELKVELGDQYDAQKCKVLSKDAKKILSFLSPGEEKKLLKAFGLVDDQK